MKYTRLTKEQFEELHLEFARFLASQNIDKAEWEQLKTEKPEVAEQELDVFSDLVWEGALNQTEYLEHFSKNHIFLFRFFENEAQSVVISALDNSLDFLSKEGIVWLSGNLTSDKIEIRKGKKVLQDRNVEIFNLIRQGALISKGELFETFN
jgi:hypothetical protein